MRQREQGPPPPRGYHSTWIERHRDESEDRCAPACCLQGSRAPDYRSRPGGTPPRRFAEHDRRNRRALVDAYVMGRAHPDSVATLSSDETNDCTEWTEIPPRARVTLAAISRSLDAEPGGAIAMTIGLDRIEQTGRWRDWRHVDTATAHSFSTGGVAPLVRLGLLERVDGREDRLQLTERGIATCREYWRRSKANDPTVPKISLR